MVYEPNGITVKEETIFVYSAGKLVEEYSTKTPPTNPTTSYTATDQLGSPRVITDSNGNVVSRRDFMPFGEEVTNNIGERSAESLKYGVADGVRQKFTGYQNDEETRLDFAEARMYENRHGRFTAVDPLLASGKLANPQSFNRYVYCLNNPLIFTDPSGLQAGKWYYPVDASGNSIGGTYKYILNGESTTGFKEQTERNRAGDLIGEFQSNDPVYGAEGPWGSDYVAKFNPNGPRKAAEIMDINSGRRYKENLTKAELNGYEFIKSDNYRENHPWSGRVDNAIEPFDVALALTPFKFGGVGRSAAAAVEELPLSFANKFGLRPSNELQSAVGKDSGLQIHHLFEKRFADILGEKASQMQSVALTKTEHQVFTNAWRRAIPYGNSRAAITTATATREQVLAAGREIYRKYPSIMKVLGLE